MPELRKDPILGRWVIIATERAKRPDQFITQPVASHPAAPCPFCPGHESKTPPEIYAIRPANPTANTPGWDVRVVPSIAPFLRVEGTLDRKGRGLYDVMNGIGAHEIIIETNRHTVSMADMAPEEIAKVLTCYVDRIVDLEKDTRLKYVLVFKNHGWSAGASKYQHSRSQLIATPVDPKRVKEELVGSKRYYEYHERCVYCDLIRQEAASGERLVAQEGGFIAVTPFASRFPFETWILPEKHSCDFTSIASGDRIHLARLLKTVLSKLKKGLNDPPYNYVLHTAPFRRPKIGAWKTIEHDYHWHIEIIPRLTRIAGFEWGTGFYICPIPPEEAARFLRSIEV